MPLAPENSLEKEKHSRPLWYGLGLQSEEGYKEFLVNAGGPNEAIVLAEELITETKPTGPYNLDLITTYQCARLIWLCGSERQAIPTNDLRLTLEVLGDEPFIDFTPVLINRL